MPDYPHQKPEGHEWRDAVLFSIAGWMSSWYGWAAPKIATAFGGYFRLDIKTGCIDGEIIDTFGAAKIEGLLENDKMTFQKTYIYRAVPHAAEGIIHYSFEKKPENDRWCGRFNTSDGSKGKAECGILPVVQDAFGLVVGPVRLK